MGSPTSAGAPIVLNFILNAPEVDKRPLERTVQVMTAGAAPPAAVLEGMEANGFRITHVYGLTETYGPSVICSWKPEWDDLPSGERASIKARQGVRYHALDGLAVMDRDTMTPVPSDGETMGEVMMRGNIVMKGYLKNPGATSEAFEGGWFHSGDLGVSHPDGYVQLKDRSKDIIISGGENISSIEVEDCLYRHPAVLEAAVVAKPDDHWGETPCAFVTLRDGATATEPEIIDWCRANLAHFKCPRTVIFGDLPKTSTGKIQKFKLRAEALEGLTREGWHGAPRCPARVRIAPRCSPRTAWLKFTSRYTNMRLPAVLPCRYRRRLAERGSCGSHPFHRQPPPHRRAAAQFL